MKASVFGYINIYDIAYFFILFRVFYKSLLTYRGYCDKISKVATRGCSSMAESQPSKLVVWVRFPSPAPVNSIYAVVAQSDRATAF